jgi:NAD(P)-dependent dehydrogenase (short-subunit alcohol dehydrogenase family)
MAPPSKTAAHRVPNLKAPVIEAGSGDGMRLKDKVALVTGATGGIGAGIARRFALEGAKVVLTGRRQASAQAVADEIRAAGGEALGLALEVTEAAQWQGVVAQTLQAWGRLDILVNNAALHKTTPFEDISPEEWREVVDVDLTGPFLGARAVLPAMREQRRGAIVNIGSIGALKGSSFAHYSAAKGGVRTLTKHLACRYAKEGIRANLVLPGLIETPLTAAALADPQKRQWLAQATPMPRFGTPDDIAYAALYLASDEASFVTGAELVVDGGVMAQ